MQPIKVSNYSIHSELIFTKQSFHSSQNLEEYDIDLKVNKSSIKFPLLFRYTLPYSGLRPFLNTGLALEFNLQKDHSIYFVSKKEKTFDGKSIYQTEIHKPTTQLPDLHLGLVFGGGVEYKINRRNFISFELRGTKMLKNGTNFLTNNDIQFLTSFNF